MEWSLMCYSLIEQSSFPTQWNKSSYATDSVFMYKSYDNESMIVVHTDVNILHLLDPLLIGSVISVGMHSRF